MSMRYDLARVFPISQCVWRYAEIVGSVGDPQIVAELVHRRRFLHMETGDLEQRDGLIKGLL